MLKFRREGEGGGSAHRKKPKKCPVYGRSGNLVFVCNFSLKDNRKFNHDSVMDAMLARVDQSANAKKENNVVEILSISPLISPLLLYYTLLSCILVSFISGPPTSAKGQPAAALVLPASTNQD